MYQQPCVCVLAFLYYAAFGCICTVQCSSGVGSIVCMYVCMYVCMHVYMYVCKYVYVCVCMYACPYMCVYVCMCMYVCMRASVQNMFCYLVSKAPPGRSSVMEFQMVGFICLSRRVALCSDLVKSVD